MMHPLAEHVLFVCTGNTCRSPMAQALYNLLARQRGLDTFATSAGIMACEGMPASMGAQCAMEEYGADLTLHQAQTVTAQMLARADVVLCMQQSHQQALLAKYPQFRQKIHTLTQYAFGAYQPVEDPFGGDEEVYRRCARQIFDAVSKILEI